MRISDWSSDVCSSDLHPVQVTAVLQKVETDMGTTGAILVRHDIPSRKGLVEDDHEVRDLPSLWVVAIWRVLPFPPVHDLLFRRFFLTLSAPRKFVFYCLFVSFLLVLFVPLFFNHYFFFFFFSF